MPDPVEIFEVGPRDGLQNETRAIPTADKIALINQLSGAGFRRIEVASFVNPKRVPQMADGAEVLAGITRIPNVIYAVLTPNMRGLERAIAAGANEIAVFASASEGFSQANINCSISESFQRFGLVIVAAHDKKLQVRGYVSCVTDCPYDGPTDPKMVARVAGELFGMGCYEISLGDTIGSGTPDRIRAMLGAVIRAVPAENLAGHYHDTASQALQNIQVSLDLGIRVFDSAIGGLGGCPFAPGSPGNVATEAVHDRLTDLGYVTGLDRQVLARAAEMAKQMTKRQ